MGSTCSCVTQLKKYNLNNHINHNYKKILKSNWLSTVLICKKSLGISSVFYFQEGLNTTNVVIVMINW